MCNYIVNGGKVCSGYTAKSKDRCSYHPISKFKSHETDSNKAKSIIEEILDLNYEKRIRCACGGELLRWNYSRHCMGQKHKYWMSLMPHDVQELTSVDKFIEYREMGRTVFGDIIHLKLKLS